MNLKLKNVSLNKKLFGFAGFSSVLVLAALGTGGFNFFQIEQANLLKEDVAKTVETVLVTRTAEKTYLQFFKPEQKQEFAEKARNVGEWLGKLRSSTANEEWKKRISVMEGHFESYQKLFQEIDELHTRHNSLMEETQKPLRVSEEKLRKIQSDLESKQALLQLQGEPLSDGEFGVLNAVKDCRDLFIQLQNIQLQYLMTGDQKFIQEYQKRSSGEAQALVTGLINFVIPFKKQYPSWQDATAGIKESLNKFMGSVNESQQLYRKESEKLSSLNESGANVLSTANALSDEVRQSIDARKDQAVKLVCSFVFLALLVFWVLSVFLVRSITGQVRKLARGLTGVADHVSAASGQVGDASRELADGSSKQSAAVEETSSSLEEMAAMTAQNAENASHANKLMMETKQTVEQANQSMQSVTASMKEISNASEQTQKIIKTIDEVAFQTNLLALNAAVEAARAGEAGAGFAVVAEEVRNLARRTAESAKDTAALIESTVKKVKEGAVLVERTNSEFGLVKGTSSKAGGLVGEIAAASREQSMGIEQINRAVAEMNQIIQSNAASAEESSSASLDLNSRVQDLHKFIRGLNELIGGSFKEDTKTMKQGGSKGGGLFGSLPARANKGSGSFTPECEISPDQKQELSEKAKEQEAHELQAKYLHTF